MSLCKMEFQQLKFILCIDDEPKRYHKLRRLCHANFHQNGLVVVTTCHNEDVLEYLDGPVPIYGICLDHDMPLHDGVSYAKLLGDTYLYPVVITSWNPVGSQRIQYFLTQTNTPNIAIPAGITSMDSDNYFETLVLDFFRQHQSIKEG